jgi:superfamily II DNA/RNA helicase
VINELYQKPIKGVNTLIVVPTRELALQIDQQIQGLAYFLNVNSIALYGGTDGSEWDLQKKALTSDTHIVVATPGKLLAHLDMGYVDFSGVEHFIMDEADRMLDMGFIEDLKAIISYLPPAGQRQTLMFSATMPPKIRELAKKILHNPSEISLALSKPAEGVLQACYLCFNNQKIPLINSLIRDKPEYKSILIFSATRRMVNEIAKTLRTGEYRVQEISSDLEQKEREKVLQEFKSKKIRILVATDVLSRGIDIKDIDLVINYDVPNDAEDYVHRVGRTARAKGTGVALTLVNPEEMYRIRNIEKLIENEILKLNVPPDLGKSPEWSVKPRGNFKKNYRRNKNR